jgi:hypothetical protein
MPQNAVDRTSYKCQNISKARVSSALFAGANGGVIKRLGPSCLAAMARNGRFDRFLTCDRERTLSGLIPVRSWMSLLLSAEHLLELGSVFEICHLPPICCCSATSRWEIDVPESWRCEPVARANQKPPPKGHDRNFAIARIVKPQDSEMEGLLATKKRSAHCWDNRCMPKDICAPNG